MFYPMISETILKNLALVCKSFYKLFDEDIWHFICQLIWCKRKDIEINQNKQLYKAIGSPNILELEYVTWKKMYNYKSHPRFDGYYINNHNDEYLIAQKTRCFRFYSPSTSNTINFIGAIKYLIKFQACKSVYNPNNNTNNSNDINNKDKYSYDVMEGFYIAHKENNNIIVSLTRNKGLNTYLSTIHKQVLISKAVQTFFQERPKNFTIDFDKMGKYINFQIQSDERGPNNMLVYQKQNKLFQSKQKDRVCLRLQVGTQFKPFIFQGSNPFS